MDKPLCRVCGVKHWGSEGHVFKEVEDSGRTSVVLSPKSEGKVDVAEVSLETGQVARNRRWREKNREKYNQYMKDYRRRKRNE